MKVKGREDADFGFRMPEEGWHQVKILEGIGELKNKDGAIIADKNGNNRFTFPMAIDGGEDDGIRVSLVTSANTVFGEQVIADLLHHTGLEAAFNEKFPGDNSYWDADVINAVKVKLQDKFVQAYIEISKDGKYSNVRKIFKAGAPAPDIKGGKKATKEAATTGTTSSPKADW
jgi:hypothetical protein